jgi:acetyl esterase/lipase
MKCSPLDSHRVTSIVMAAVLAVLASPLLAAEGKVELLWPDGAPGAKGDAPADKPTLAIHLPEPGKANGAAMIVCPGGGYGHLAVSYEGHDIAKWCNSLGMVGFVLEYRHRGRGYGHPAPLQDAQRAIRTVRARADEFKINPSRIGILGFSAGGHLVSSVGTHFDKGDPNAKDPIQRVSCRPDFMVLCYPVITLDKPYAERGSRDNLLGANADPKLIESMSSEKQVTPDTPPAFIFATDEDKGVPAENSVDFYLALRRAKVPAELHIYQHGPHGVGLGAKYPGTANWPTDCADWMRGLGVLPKP